MKSTCPRPRSRPCPFNEHRTANDELFSHVMTKDYLYEKYRNENYRNKND